MNSSYFVGMNRPFYLIHSKLQNFETCFVAEKDFNYVDVTVHLSCVVCVADTSFLNTPVTVPS